MANENIQLVLLPGLGGDWRMTYRQAALPYIIIRPNYIPLKKGDTIRSYAKRFALHLLETNTVDLTKPIVLGGISFGGMIAQEMANYIPSKGIILIGSMRSSSELARYVHFFGRHIAQRLPLWAYDIVGEYFLPIIMRLYSKVSEQHIQLCCTMYKEYPKEFFRDSFRLITEWQGADLIEPVFRIHGKHDHIISYKRSQSIDVVVEDAKHLINLSHAEQVNEFIESFIEKLFHIPK